MNPLARLLALLAVTSLASVVACAPAAEEEEDDGSAEALSGRGNEQWVYNGTLPHLEDPSITVSLTAHTARVTGFIPADWDQQLPYYASAVEENGRKKVAVVYPMATGSSVNSQGTSYNITQAIGYTPTNSDATWGGFPFLPYNGGIAFHGPITKDEASHEWKLIRGAVSHGCNRMQGEHVVELTHLIGLDMSSRLYQYGYTALPNKVPVTVLRTAADTWQGQQVDVDYPAGPRCTRPTGENVKVFPSWTADQLKGFVCSIDASSRGQYRSGIPAGYCSSRFQNTIDPVTGR